MNPEFTRIHVDRKTHEVSVTLKWHDGSEKVYSSEDLRYRLGNCAEVNEDQDAYQLAILNIKKIEAFLDMRSQFAKTLISLQNSI
jgi:hypothetical protein|tara:strand:- start:2236 stop:2490 length:255 start_codon:yes stop_codon:yes gene_type:complete